MRIRLIGFYKGQFINEDVLLLDKNDYLALNLLRSHFWGAIKRIRG